MIDEAKEEWVPYIVNELVYYIVNNNIDLSKFVNLQAIKVTRQQLDQLLTQIKFKPTDAKEMTSLYQYLAFEGDNQQISLQRLLNSIRKINPNYGVKTSSTDEYKGKGSTIKNAKTAQTQLVQFTPKIK